MKGFFIIFITILFSKLLNAQAERIVYENFTPKSQEIGFDLPGEIEVKYWKRDYIRVLTIINTENCDIEMLNTLIDSGRYQLKSDLSNGISFITLPLLKEVKLIEENQLIENFKFEIRLPEGIFQKKINN